MALKRQQDDERSDRLRAYDGKDYSEVIEFPVELVDRDGVVRRYSYEESLAVYHRRIQSAPWRYADDDLIRAEIGHCTRRIEQIKRSYATRTRHSGPSAASNPRASLGEGWEIVVRYYEAALAARRLSLNTEFDVKVALLQDEPVCRIYHLAFGARGGHLLYIYPFDRVGDGDPRESFEQAQIGFRGQVQGVGVERMLLPHPEHIHLLSIDEMNAYADQGVMMEHSYTLIYSKKLTHEYLFEMIRGVGPERTLLGSDLGQPGRPNPVQGFRSFIENMLKLGLSDEEIRVVLCDTPRRLLGLD